MMCRKCDFQLMDDMGYGDAVCPECGWTYFTDDDDCYHENVVFTEFGDYCDDCGEEFEDFTGSNFMGG